MPRSARIAQAVTLLIVGGALAVRWLHLDAESLWYDEGYTAWLTSCAPGQIVRNLSVDIGAPLHYVLLHYWRTLFGDGDIALRNFSAVCSTLAVGVFWILARRILQRPWAVMWAMALLSFSVMQIEQAREARYYALLSLLGILMLEGMDRYLRSGSRWAFAQFVISSAAALYCHNIAAFYLIAIQVAWLLWPCRVRCANQKSQWFAQRTVHTLLLADTLILLLYAPWLPILHKQLEWMKASGFWDVRPDWAELLWTIAILAGTKSWYPGRTVTWLRSGRWEGSTEIASAIGVLAVLSIVALILWRSRRADRRMAVALAIFALLPVIALFIQSLLRQPSFVDRTFIMSSPALCLLLAIPLFGARRHDAALSSEGESAGPKQRGVVPPHSIAQFVLLGILFASAFYSVKGFLTEEHKEDWRGVVQYVAALPDQPRVIVFLGNEGQLPFDHYAAKFIPRPSYEITGAPRGFFDLEPPQTIRRVLSDADLQPLRQRLKEQPGYEIVLITRNETYYDPQGRVRSLLDAGGILISDKQFRLVTIRRYTPLPGGFVYSPDRPFDGD